VHVVNQIEMAAQDYLRLLVLRHVENLDHGLALLVGRARDGQIFSFRRELKSERTLGISVKLAKALVGQHRRKVQKLFPTMELHIVGLTYYHRTRHSNLMFDSVVRVKIDLSFPRCTRVVLSDHVLI
jgi:hypothetical protein